MKKASPKRGRELPKGNYFSQTWLPTVQEVLQADWQDAWHSPQPPVLSDFCIVGLLTVWMCFMENSPSQNI